MEMSATCTLLAVHDLKQSIEFYTGVLGYRVELDMGGNVTLSNNLALQELESWAGFLLELPTGQVSFGGNNMEIVLETEEMDDFLALLAGRPDVKLVHEARTYPWGQRVVRVYDPDSHIIEVGESMKMVVKRFFTEGNSLEEIQAKTMYPIEFLLMCKQEMEAGQ